MPNCSFYIVIKATGYWKSPRVARMSKKEPTLAVGERSLHVTIELPEGFLNPPKPSVKLSIPDDDAKGPALIVASVEVQPSIIEQILTRLGTVEERLDE